MSMKVYFFVFLQFMHFITLNTRVKHYFSETKIHVHEIAIQCFKNIGDYEKLHNKRRSDSELQSWTSQNRTSAYKRKRICKEEEKRRRREEVKQSASDEIL